MGSSWSSDEENEEDFVASINDVLPSGFVAMLIPQRNETLDATPKDDSTACLFCKEFESVHSFTPCACKAICNRCAANYPKISETAGSRCLNCNKTIKQIA